MKKLAILATVLGLAACDNDRVIDRDYNTVVPADNEVIVNEAREVPTEGDERPR